MEKDHVQNAIGLSNKALIPMAFREGIFFISLILLDFSNDIVFCLSFLAFSIFYLILFILVILLLVEYFRASKLSPSNKNIWIGAGIVNVATLFLFTIFFPFMMRISMYIFNYPLIKKEGYSKWGLSLLLYVFASFCTMMLFLMNGISGPWVNVFGGSFIFTIFIISHVTMYQSNSEALISWNLSQKKEVKTVFHKQPRYDTRKIQRAHLRVQPPVINTENMPKQVPSTEVKPRILEAPPGYD